MFDSQFYRKNGYFPYPKTMQIEITTACPLRCPQCFIDNFNAIYVDYDDYVRLIDEAYQIGVRGVILFGGEPLLHKKINEFISYASVLGMNVFIYTSGWNIEKIIETVRRFSDKVILLLSMNGSTKKVHELSRDNYFLTFNAMKFLSENNIQYAVNWVARHDNVDDFENLISLSQRYKASFINIVGNKISSAYSVQQALTENDYLKLVSVYTKYNDYLKIENCNAQFQNLVGRTTVFSGCTAGILNCSVTADMNFVPCLRLMYKEKYPSIKDYWNNSPVLTELRKTTSNFSYCKDCQYEKRCRYCRAQSLESYENFHVGIKKCVVRRIDNVKSIKM